MLHFDYFATKVLTLSVLLLGPCVAMAGGTVRSDFALQVDSSIFDSADFDLMKRLQGDEAVTLPDAMIQDEAPVFVQGIQAQVKYKLKAGSRKVVLGAEQFLASEEISARVQIRKIAIDGVVERNDGGNRIRVRVQGACQNISLDLPKGESRIYASFSAGLDTQGLPVLSVPWFDVQWGEKSWKLSPFSCSGLDGLEDKVRQGIANYLKSSKGFNGQLREAIQTRLKEAQSQIRASLLSPRVLPLGLDGVKATIYPRRIAYLNGLGFQVRGDIDFVFEALSARPDVEVRGVNQGPAAGGGFSLWFPEQLLSVLTQAVTDANLFNISRKGNDIAAFRELRNSLGAWYVWPEIKEVSSNQDFLFQFAPSERPLLGQLQDLRDGTLQAPFTSRWRLMTWLLPKSSSPQSATIPFDRFESKANGPLRFFFAPGAAGPELRIVFRSVAMDLTHEWDPTYLPRAKNTEVDTATIQDKLADAMKSDGVSIPVGTIPLVTGLLLSPQRMGLQAQWLRIDLAN